MVLSSPPSKSRAEKIWSVLPLITAVGIGLAFLFGTAAGIGAFWGILTGGQVFLGYWAMGRVLGESARDARILPFDTLALMTGFGLKAICIGIGVPLLNALGYPSTPAFVFGLLWVYCLAIGWVISRRDS